MIMPAVTGDYSRLPRLDGPPREARERPVLSVTSAPTGLEGEGFPVHRAFSGVRHALLDPFVHMDQMGAVNYAPGEPKGTPWHPHRDLHDRRSHAAPGLSWGRRDDRGRRHSMDDGRFGDVAHRDTAGGRGDVGRPFSWCAVVGESAREEE